MEAGHALAPRSHGAAYSTSVSTIHDCRPFNPEDLRLRIREENRAPSLYRLVRCADATAIPLWNAPLFALFASALLAIAVLSGCTHVQVYGASVETESKFGIAFVKITPGPNVPSAVITEGVGLTVGSQSTTIGWGKEEVVAFPDAAACRVIILVEKNSADRLAELLLKNPKLFSNVCVTQTGS